MIFSVANQVLKKSKVLKPKFLKEATISELRSDLLRCAQARSIFLRVIRFALFGVYISIKETIWASSQRKGHGAFPKVLTNIGMNCTIKAPVSYTIFINNEAGKRLCQ